MRSRDEGPRRAGSRRALLAVAVTCGLIAAWGWQTAAAEDTRPNILVVLVDDMGWSDPGCYGGEVATPHLDALAADGLRFSAFYNTGRCCPTRASLLTGLYPHQAGLGRMTFDQGLPGYRGFLQPHAVTIAELLGEAGYRTAMVGKWHLSLTQQREGHLRHLNNQEILSQFSSLDSYPVNRGFEEHYGIIWGVVNFFDPFSLVHNTEPVREVPDDYYITDAFTEWTLRYIDQFASGDAPFFLYLAHCAPHWPLHALPEDIQKYDGAYDVGWDAIRRARYERQVRGGLLDPSTAPLSPPFRPDRDWEANSDRDWDAAAMACHAAMIDRVDQGLGRIVERLRERGELENTVIFFLSDNGASREEPTNPGFDRVSETREGEPIVYFGRNGNRSRLPGPETTYAGIGPDWANVANTPFRRFKATQYEGGIRTPLVVHWPAGLGMVPGSVTAEPGHVIDLMPTCLELAETPYPDTFADRELIPSPGLSLVPILRSGERRGHEAIYFEHFGERAIRAGEWKLVAGRNQPWELYHLVTDQTEVHNLAEDHPERIAELSAAWENWARASQVLPSPQPPRRQRSSN